MPSVPVTPDRLVRLSGVLAETVAPATGSPFASVTVIFNPPVSARAALHARHSKAPAIRARHARTTLEEVFTFITPLQLSSFGRGCWLDSEGSRWARSPPGARGRRRYSLLAYKLPKGSGEHNWHATGGLSQLEFRCGTATDALPMTPLRRAATG